MFTTTAPALVAANQQVEIKSIGNEDAADAAPAVEVATPEKSED